MSSQIPFTEIAEGVPATKPFVGPETIERDQSRMFEASMGANESAFGVSPAAAKAMQDAIQSASWSGDPENFDLRKAPAEKHGVSMDEVVVGGGIATNCSASSYA